MFSFGKYQTITTVEFCLILSRNGESHDQRVSWNYYCEKFISIYYRYEILAIWIRYTIQWFRIHYLQLDSSGGKDYSIKPSSLWRRRRKSSIGTYPYRSVYKLPGSPIHGTLPASLCSRKQFFLEFVTVELMLELY